MKKHISLFLLMAMLASVSCGGASSSNDTTAQTTAPETEADIFDGMKVENYGGRDFNFLIRDGWEDGFWLEEPTGDVLDDTIYERNQLVEERFNINIKPILIDGGWSDRSTYIGTIRSSVMAGDGSYDLIDGYAGVIGDGFADKLYLNLLEVPNLRFDEAWWSGTLRDSLTVNDKLYAMTGDYALNMWGMLEVVYFNKGMMDDYGREYPYERVRNGTWTYDSFLSDIKDVGADLNGDSTMDITDRYGFISYDSRVFEYFRNAAGISYGRENAAGEYELDLASEKVINLYEKLNALATENPDMFYLDASADWAKIPASMKESFLGNRTMYYQNSLESSIDMRSADIEFGIVPYPKADKDQESYYSDSRDDRTMFVIPIDVKDVAFVGNILEALTVWDTRW